MKTTVLDLAIEILDTTLRIHRAELKIHEQFYKLTVAERDYERLVNDRLRLEIDILTGKVPDPGKVK